MRNRLLKLENEHLIGLEDAAVIVRNEEGKVKANQEANMVGGSHGRSLLGTSDRLLLCAYIRISLRCSSWSRCQEVYNWGYGRTIHQISRKHHSAWKPSIVMLVREFTPGQSNGRAEDVQER